MKGTLDVSPTHTMTTIADGQVLQRRLSGGQYGLRNNHNFSIGPDVSWDITPAMNYACLLHVTSRSIYDQASLYVSGTNTTAHGTGYYVPYTANTTDSVQTFGLTTDWQVIRKC